MLKLSPPASRHSTLSRPSLSRPGLSGRLRESTILAGVILGLAGAPLMQAQAQTQGQTPVQTPVQTPAATSTVVTPQNAVAIPSLAPLVKKVLPAVVNISAIEDPTPTADSGAQQEQFQTEPGQSVPGFPPSPFDQYLRRFFQQQGPQQHQQQDEKRIALGSGFIIDPSGYVVTNNHVVQGSSKVTVIFQDGSKHPAKIIGRDVKTDLALLKIDVGHPLPYVQWGNSGASQVGDWVLAVGNPFGLGGTVSSGIISARGRDIHEGPYDDFLQLDASINRGNSGGPTFNLAGQVIGINTAIYSPNGGSVGIGFAIPSDLAKPVIQQLRAHGKVERGWLGVQIQQVSPAIAKNLGLPKDEGALVADVSTGTPAAKAGLKQGDVILSFDGHEINKLRDLPLVVAETPIGETSQVKIWRSGHEMTLHPVIAQMPQNPKMAQNGESGVEASSAMGLHLSPLTAEWRHRLHLGENVKGVVVTGIGDNSPLAELDIERGDVIESINQQPVTSPEEAASKLNAIQHEKGDKTALLLLNRHGVNEFVSLSVDTGNGNGNG